jgi:hypothetical protein
MNRASCIERQVPKTTNKVRFAQAVRANRYGAGREEVLLCEPLSPNVPMPTVTACPTTEAYGADDLFDGASARVGKYYRAVQRWTVLVSKYPPKDFGRSPYSVGRCRSHEIPSERFMGHGSHAEKHGSHGVNGPNGLG